MPSAISLNSGIFNGARVIGSGIAGFLIAIIGVEGAFLINAVSYLAVILALLAMKTISTVHKTHPNPFLAIKEGVDYAANHLVIRTLLLFAGITSVLAGHIPRYFRTWYSILFILVQPVLVIFTLLQE